MEKNLACFDIDGTLAKGMLAIPLVISEYQSGFVDTSICIKLAKLVIENKICMLDDETAMHKLLQTHALGLAGQHESEVKNHAERFIQHSDNFFRSIGKKTIELLKDSHELVIVTTEPQYIAEVVQSSLKMDSSVSTQYEVINGIFTGKIAASLAGFDSKLKSLEDRGIHIAFGNTECDKEMLKNAEHQFCIFPDKNLREFAEKEGWFIYTGNDSAIINTISEIISGAITDHNTLNQYKLSHLAPYYAEETGMKFK